MLWWFMLFWRKICTLCGAKINPKLMLDIMLYQMTSQEYLYLYLTILSVFVVVRNLMPRSAEVTIFCRGPPLGRGINGIVGRSFTNLFIHKTYASFISWNRKNRAEKGWENVQMNAKEKLQTKAKYPFVEVICWLLRKAGSWTHKRAKLNFVEKKSWGSR